MKQLSRLQQVPLREIWKHEAQDFTPWLAEDENLKLLQETVGLELERTSAALDFSTVSERILQHLMSKLDTKMNVTLEIEAALREGFDDPFFGLSMSEKKATLSAATTPSVRRSDSGARNENVSLCCVASFLREL